MNGNKAPARRDCLFAFLLVVLTLIAFGPVCHAGFIWDDDAYVTNNPLLTGPDGLRRIWFSLDAPSQYFPLTYTTLYIERGLWGLNPLGYHLVNLLLHVINALLVWRLLARLRVPGAWLAAAIFALHPVQVESVAWVTERKNVLMGIFFLLTLWAWLQFIGDTRRRWRFYALSLIFYALALFAKTTACTLPAALLLILWLKKMPIHWRRLAQVTPFAAMGLGMGLVTVWWERHHQGTHGQLFAIGPMDRGLIASRALWFYLGKLLWPAHLIFSYPRWTVSASDPGAYGWLAATAALGLVIWRIRRRTGRGVEVAAIYFAATLSPVLGFIMLYTFLYSFVADHYQYLACIGPIALAAAAMKLALGRLGANRTRLQGALAAVLLTVLGVLTWRQCGLYSQCGDIMEATLSRNPGSGWRTITSASFSIKAAGRTRPSINTRRRSKSCPTMARSTSIWHGHPIRRATWARPSPSSRRPRKSTLRTSRQSTTWPGCWPRRRRRPGAMECKPCNWPSARMNWPTAKSCHPRHPCRRPGGNRQVRRCRNGPKSRCDGPGEGKQDLANRLGNALRRYQGRASDAQVKNLFYI